jgi:thiol-disulfide isomerase/thioredoxin
MKTSLLLNPLLVLLSASGPIGKPFKDEGKTEVKVLNWQAFADAIKGDEGKIVIVYCWASYDPVSIKELPRLMKMQQKCADMGVTIVTLSLDPKTEKRAQRVEEILSQGKAAVPNFILDEKAEVWQKKLDTKTEPAVVIFDKKGNRTASFDSTGYESSDALFAAAQKAVGKLLAEK